MWTTPTQTTWTPGWWVMFGLVGIVLCFLSWCVHVLRETRDMKPKQRAPWHPFRDNQGRRCDRRVYDPDMKKYVRCDLTPEQHKEVYGDER